MANASVQMDGHQRKGKLEIRHASRFKSFLILNDLLDTHIRFNRRLQRPFTIAGERKIFESLFEEAFTKQNGKKELAH